MELSRVKKNKVEIWHSFIQCILAILDGKKRWRASFLSSTWKN
jgi:hypothetical protein